MRGKGGPTTKDITENERKKRNTHFEATLACKGGGGHSTKERNYVILERNFEFINSLACIRIASLKLHAQDFPFL